MKKLMVLAAVAALGVAAKADMAWSWWLEKPERKTDISLGIATGCASVSAFDLSLIYGSSCVENGAQWSFFGINDSDKSEVLQFSWWFNRGDQSCAQVACVNVAKKNVFNLGFVNFAESSKVQLGLVNFNKNGFLPIFPFINLDKSLFN